MGGGLAIQNDTDRTIYVELYHVPDWVYHACTVEPYSKADIRCGRVWFTVAVHDAAIKNAKEDRSAEFEGLFGEIDDLSSVEHAVAISHVKNAPPGVCRGSTRNAVTGTHFQSSTVFFFVFFSFSGDRDNDDCLSPTEWLTSKWWKASAVYRCPRTTTTTSTTTATTTTTTNSTSSALPARNTSLLSEHLSPC
eukprot:gnl/Spiro4/18849_TR10073_c0_g2_i1.p1 gnl/Spiro4/18849_TR10073_c0_g2~~gnl/Spiro4/18849_TR10073_c0_g2_i1.p1  ORF type:complete len:193 (-),score=39.34 gnl/Spiro4/18849_TR10073_c0_g2_i1:63-641(-)